MKNVKFRKYKPTTLQSTLRKDIKNMRNDEKMYVAADKTSNFYKTAPENYNTLLENNITKEYKKDNKRIVEKVNKNDKKIATKLELDNRIYSISERQAFITLKDHKDSFPNNPKCRLINPSKSEVGKVSKVKLSRIVNVVREETKYNH